MKWSQDRAFCLANEWTLDLPADEVRQWWRKRGQTSPYLRMVVLDDEVVGYAEWQNLQGGVAELGIAIGDSGRWGQGLGARAGQMMLELGFWAACPAKGLGRGTRAKCAFSKPDAPFGVEENRFG